MTLIMGINDFSQCEPEIMEIHLQG
jgi:hypothetical protein